MVYESENFHIIWLLVSIKVLTTTNRNSCLVLVVSAFSFFQYFSLF